MKSFGKSVRAVVFLPSIETGGVERNAIIVANHLVDCGYSTSLTYTRIVETMRHRFHENVQLLCIGKRVRFPFVHPRIIDVLVMFRGYMQYLKREKLHGNTVVISFQSNIVAIIGARLAGVPVVVRVSNHPSHVKYESGMIQKVSEKLKPFFYRFADVVITNSEVNSKLFRHRLSVPVKTIYNPIDPDKLREKSKEAVEHPWLILKDLPVLISVGRLVKQKNFSFLIKSFFEVLKQIDARLIILGEGKERENLEAIIDDLTLHDKVDLPGYYSNVHSMVAKADLFVLSSNFEGMPNALLEAIAVGTPAISTNCLSGPSEILCGGEAGDLVPINDTSAMAEAILTNLKNSERTQGLFFKARNKLLEFDEQTILSKYRKVLMDLVIVNR